MTQEQKDLLLKDLCARLPYGVIVGTTDNDGTIPNFWSLDMYNRLTEDVRLTNCEVDADCLTDFCDVCPYLFPLSSMTEEQRIDLTKYLDARVFVKDEIRFQSLYANTMDRWKRVFEWCIKNHFDICGLIPMGLANDATGKNIY